MGKSCTQGGPERNRRLKEHKSCSVIKGTGSGAEVKERGLTPAVEPWENQAWNKNNLEKEVEEVALGKTGPCLRPALQRPFTS